MSSYMLERLATVRFDIAVLLNLSPDHLTAMRYGHYIAAKTHIFDRQGQDDLAVLGYDDDARRCLPAPGKREACAPAAVRRAFERGGTPPAWQLAVEAAEMPLANRAAM